LNQSKALDLDSEHLLSFDRNVVNIALL
jgi:hypothetical protein